MRFSSKSRAACFYCISLDLLICIIFYVDQITCRCWGRQSADARHAKSRSEATNLHGAGASNLTDNNKGKQDSILLGKLRCGKCKRSLNRIVCTKVPCFVCGRAKYDKGGGCFDGRLKEPEAEDAVLRHIRQKVEESREGQLNKEKTDKEREVLVQGSGSLKLGGVQTKSKGALLGKKLDALKIEKQYLYEHFKLKQVDRDLYLNKVGELREEERVICEEIRRAKEEKDEDREGQENQSSFQKVDGLTKEIVKQMIDVIYVNEEGEFEVIWKK